MPLCNGEDRVRRRGSPLNAGLTARPNGGLTSDWCFIGRESGEPSSDGKANDGFGWCARPPRGEKARDQYSQR